MRRPFDGRVELHRQGGFTSGRVTNREYLWQLGEDGDLIFGVRRPPGGPARDASYAALRDASRDGVVARRGSGRVRGRACTWFAYEDPAKSLRPPTLRNFVESCVDRSGILLQELWTVSGRLVQTATAVSVDDRPAASSRFLEGVDPRKTKVRSPEAEQLINTGFIVADQGVVQGVPIAFEPPRGWRLLRAAVVAESAGPQGAKPTQYVSEGHVRGTELVVVERGTNKNLRPTWSTSEGRAIRLARGPGRIVYLVDRVEVRLAGELGYARVIAPSRALALQFARRLRPAE